MMRIVGGLLVVAALTAPAVAGESGGDKLPKQSKQGIQSTMQKFERAWNQGQPEQMAQVYAQDARAMSPMGEQAQGKEQIQQMFERDMKESLEGSQVSLELENTRPIDSNHVLADVDLKVRNMKGPDGNPMPEQDMHSVVLFKRDGNRWQVQDVRAFTQMPHQQRPAVGGSGMEGMPPAEEPLEDGRMDGQPNQPMPPPEPMRNEAR